MTVDKIEIAKDIYYILVKNQDETALNKLLKYKKQRDNLAKLAFSLAQSFADEEKARNPSRIPWESET